MNNIGSLGWGPEMPFIALPFFILLLVWSLFWKGLALWHSARRAQHVWFIVMLVLNTAGILEIIYLFGVAKIKFNDLISTRSGHAA